MKFETEFTISWGDCDPAGIVFYPRFFYWFDTTYQRWLQAKGLSQAILQQRHGILGTGVLDAHAEFCATSRDGDAMVVEARIEEWRTKTFRVNYSCKRGELLVARGHEVRGWFMMVDGRVRAAEIPDDFRTAFD